MSYRTPKVIAVDLLSRREYSREQLTRKLLDRQIGQDEIKDVLDDLERQNFLSDDRFTDTYLAQRTRKGYGPLKIRQELLDKGICIELISEKLQQFENLWPDLLHELRGKKFGGVIPDDYKGRIQL